MRTQEDMEDRTIFQEVRRSHSRHKYHSKEDTLEDITTEDTRDFKVQGRSFSLMFKDLGLRDDRSL
jgi:hypothetical protein